MIKIISFVERYLQSKILLFAIGILFLTNIFSLGYILKNSNKKEECICEECPKDIAKEVVETSKIKVDIKGYVKKPGVYELENGTIVNDLIKLAGGLKNNGTTDNINLSKKLSNEDMIVVASKTELKKQKNSSIISSTATNLDTNNKTILEEKKENQSKKVSINTATKEELMSLNGIGESKAVLIIEYRTNSPFKDISEIKNVSGIGESIYEKIKDNITI